MDRRYDAVHRRCQVNGRLVGHDVDETLILGDPISSLDMPSDDFGLGDPLADVRQPEDEGRHQ
jgi:hypothetical protein